MDDSIGKTWMHLAAIAALVSSMAACAPPAQTPPTIMPGAAQSNAPLLRSTDPGAERFIPVGKLRTGTGSYNCTASLIAGADTPAPDRPALILTAGHCVEESDDNTVIVDRPGEKAWSFTPAFFIDTQPKHVSFGIARVVYATMKDVDLAVLQLDATYGDLALHGVFPLRLATATTSPETPVELTHIPVTGVPTEEQFLRYSQCRADAHQFIFEAYIPWRWSKAIPNDCQGVAGGTSGSPMFVQDGKDVIAVLNTTATPGYVGCGPGRPCELTSEGLPVPREGSSYAIPVERLALALKADSTVDLSRLDSGLGVTLTRTTTNWSTRNTEEVDGELVPARWNLKVGSTDGFDLVRYKIGLANSTNCADIDGYSTPTPIEEQPLIEQPMPRQEGIYTACVIGGRANGTWQLPSNATVRLRRIDETPPAMAPRISERELGGQLEVRPEYVPWEVTNLRVKYGPAAVVDCDTPDGYGRHRNNHWYPVENQSEPWRFCAHGVDSAGNAGPAVTRDF